MELMNTGLRIHRTIDIVLPVSIAQVMLGIAEHLKKSLEFGLYLKGQWDQQNGAVIIEDDQYYFPQQETTSTSIRFLEEPPGPEWNVVIHRHPQGCRSFSGTDRNSINEEFLASILFIPPGDFPQAIVNIPLAPGIKFQVEAKVELDEPAIELPEEIRDSLVTHLHEPAQEIQLLSPARAPVQVFGRVVQRPSSAQCVPIIRPIGGSSPTEQRGMEDLLMTELNDDVPPLDDEERSMNLFPDFDPTSRR